MDAQRFDMFVKTWSGPQSRRQALVALAGVALASVVPLAARAQSCLADGQTCRHPADCCSGGCKKKKGKKTGTCACPGKRQCSDTLCCPEQSTCCNPGAANALCCAAPGACAPLYGPGNSSDRVCCPPERTIQFTHAEKCCPGGELAVHGTSSSGPCCPEAQFCNGHCCALGSTCVNGQCQDCPEPCGNTCCPTGQICNIYQHCEDPTVCPREVCTTDGNQCCPVTSHSGGFAYCCPPTATCCDSQLGCCFT